MNRKHWLILLGTLLLLAALAASFLRPRVPAPLVSSSPSPSVSPSLTAPLPTPWIQLTWTPRPTLTPYPTYPPPPILPDTAPPATPVTLRELAAPGVPTDTLNASLADFEFSLSRVIDAEIFVYLGEWLDAERLLVSWCISPCIRPAYKAMGTYNINTGEFREYGRSRGYNIPVWLPDSEKIAFSARVDREEDEEAWWAGKDNLWISGWGEQRASAPVLEGIEYHGSLAATPGEVITVLSPTHQLAAVDPEGNVRPLPVNVGALGFDPWNYDHRFRMVSSPDRSQLALYGRVWQNGDCSYRIYLVDMADYDVETFEIGKDIGLQEVQRVRWSPDGSYLVLPDYAGRYCSGFWMLDVRQGELMMKGVPICNATWMHNNRYLFAVQGKLESHPIFLLIDTQTGTTAPVLIDQVHHESGGTYHHAWSPDDKQLALIHFGKLYLVDVTTQEDNQ